MARMSSGLDPRTTRVVSYVTAEERSHLIEMQPLMRSAPYALDAFGCVPSDQIAKIKAAQLKSYLTDKDKNFMNRIERRLAARHLAWTHVRVHLLWGAGIVLVGLPIAMAVVSKLWSLAFWAALG